jgi:alanine racemase
MDILKARMRKPTVKINGQRVRIVGKIGMTHTIVDVTKLDCRAGDIAVMEADPLNVKAIPRVYR